MKDETIAARSLASLYGTVRYYYYGLMLGTSPYRRRRDMLDELVVEPHRCRPKRKGKFAQALVETKVASSPSVDTDGEQYWTHSVTVTIPIRCRVAALIEDLDYTLPVWLNAAALGALLL